jgi:uncharacterized protein
LELASSGEWDDGSGIGLMHTRRTFLGAFATAFFGLGSYAFGYEPMYRLVTTRYDLPLPRWPRDAKPLTIAVVADIHAAEPWMTVERIAEIVAATNSLKPDLTLLLGDYVCATPLNLGVIEPQRWAKPLADLTAPLGVHAVLGNHDYWWAQGAEPVAAALRNVGIDVYVNRAAKIEANGHSFWLSGTTSMLTGPRYGFRRGPGRFNGLDDVKATMAQVTDNAPIIHMAHEPDLWPFIPDRVALTISGHTHGGQINLPFFGRPIPSLYGIHYVYGHIRERNRDLVISGGLGCSRLPIRFGVPPEIVLLTVRSGAPEPVTS